MNVPFGAALKVAFSFSLSLSPCAEGRISVPARGTDGKDASFPAREKEGAYLC